MRSHDTSSFQLKMLAVITMLIDHIGAIFVERQLTPGLVPLDTVLRGIGRLSFPLFCFFIVEGFYYTHDRKQYALRLGIFAVIAEVPFDLALNRSFWDPGDNSVMLTLLLGFLSIWTLDTLFRKFQEKHSGRTGIFQSLQIISVIGVIAAVTFAEHFLNSDYGAAGVLTILILYLLRPYKQAGFAVSVAFLAVTSDFSELFALADLIPLSFYHGRQGRRMKYFFYLFYPVHLLLLSGIAYAAGLGI